MATLREGIARRKRARALSVAPPETAWARQLRALQRTYGVARPRLSVERILAEDRQDRV